MFDFKCIKFHFIVIFKVKLCYNEHQNFILLFKNIKLILKKLKIELLFLRLNQFIKKNYWNGIKWFHTFTYTGAVSSGMVKS